MTDWQSIETVEAEQQVIVWEPSYGWLLARLSTYDGKWYIKSSGNFWAEMPASVVPEQWAKLPDPPYLAPPSSP